MTLVAFITSELLKAALWYASEFKWKVLPLWWIREDGSCGCDSPNCSSVGKHPIGQLVPNGVKNATKESATIERWWGHYPQANIGIATGAVSGFIVLDIDPRNGGDESMEMLEAKYGLLPDTVEQLTGGGGRHILFTYPNFAVNNDNQGKVLGPGIDVKGDGGYIVVAPSNHVKGSYQWK